MIILARIKFNKHSSSQISNSISTNKQQLAGLILILIVLIVFIYYFTRGESIKDIIYKAKNDFEQEKVEACLDYFSDRFFINHKYSREELKNRAIDLFNQISDVKVQIINLETKEEDDNGWAKASVKVFATFEKQKVMLLGRPTQPFEGEIFFIKEKGKWKVIQAKEFPI